MRPLVCEGTTLEPGRLRPIRVVPVGQSPVSASFSHSPFMPCPDCGASVAVIQETEHVCNPDRRLDFELFQLRVEISSLGAEIEDYLSSAHGRFEQWYAEHERRPECAEEPPDEAAAEPDL
jgi:hypothetical protein